MGYSDELQALDMQIAELTAENEDRMPEGVKELKKRKAMVGVKKPSPAEQLAAYNYTLWKKRILEGNYHAVAKIAVIGPERIVREYRTLMKVAAEITGKTELKGLRKRLKEVENMAKRYVKASLESIKSTLTAA